MYRYARMMNEFKKLPEYDGFISTNTSMKQFLFRKQENEQYLIEIKDAALSPASIYMKDKNNQYIFVEKEACELEVQKTYEEVEKIRKQQNLIFSTFLPGEEHIWGDYTIRYFDIIEEYDSHRIPHDFPNCLWIWADVIYQNQTIGEIRNVLENQGREDIPYWKLQECQWRNFSTMELSPFMKQKIEAEGKRMQEKMNMNYRLHHLLEGKQDE